MFLKLFINFIANYLKNILTLASKYKNLYFKISSYDFKQLSFRFVQLAHNFPLFD